MNFIVKVFAIIMLPPDGIVATLGLIAFLGCIFNVKNINSYCSDTCDKLKCSSVSPEPSPAQGPHMLRL